MIAAPDTELVESDLTLDQLGDTINGLIKQGSGTQHRIGVLYNHIVDRRLTDLAGYKTAQAFFSQKVKSLSQSSLSLYGTVARTFTEAVCTQYGMYKLRALISYAQVTGSVLPREPGPVTIQVPQDDGKVMVTKSFADCSLEELERATRHQRTPPRERVPVSDAARLLFLEDSLYRGFSGVAQVRLTSRNEEGKTLINLQDVPLSELTRLMLVIKEGVEAQPALAVNEGHDQTR